ncbi:MAG: YitT family protein [Firmicutes bacterium]|nr:YitT family protein [Bacillota bacterium]
MIKDKDPKKKAIKEYVLLFFAVEIMVVGIYFFKFPNHFAFGGVSGYAPVISQLTGLSSSTFTNIANYSLLILGFFVLGKSVGIKTFISTLIMSFSLSLLERFVPLEQPLTSEPLLELIFAVACPAIGSALLFNISASSGGTDIIAMILRKYTSINIGTALLLVDATSVVLAFIVFGPGTGLFSLLGLLTKSIGIDRVIENLNMTKCFTIICDDSEPICEYIIHTLGRSATVYDARGAFTHQPKTVIMTDMAPRQAVLLRNFIKDNQKGAFVQITNSSEVIGRGFLAS